MSTDFVSIHEEYAQLRDHPIRRRFRYRYLIVAIISFSAVIATGITGFWRWAFAKELYGPAVLWQWISPAFWAAVVFLLLGAAALLIYISLRKSEVQTSPIGITIQKRRNLNLIPWDSISDIHISSVQYGLLRLVWAEKTELMITTKDGKKEKIDERFEDFNTLISTVKKHVYPTLLDRYKRDFNLGEPINFGPLMLTSQGILNGRKMTRWSEIDRIRVRHGRIEIFAFENTRGPRLSIPTHKIPNIDLCVQLMYQLGPVK